MNTPLFNTGALHTTSTISEFMQENLLFAEFCDNSLNKHKSGDWGDLEEEDLEANNFSLENKERLVSVYNLPPNWIEDEEKIYIITEWDRSVTTILFPSEY